MIYKDKNTCVFILVSCIYMKFFVILCALSALVVVLISLIINLTIVYSI
jgi:hypothetical protein